MPDVIINGPEGRIEARYHHARGGTAPMAVVLHPHPLHGGTMNNKIVYTLYQTFVRRGSRPCASTFAGSAAARAALIAARASWPMRRRRSIGCRVTTRTPPHAGSRDIRLAPGSACSS